MVPLFGLLVIVLTVVVMVLWVRRSARTTASGGRFSAKHVERARAEQKRLPYRYADDKLFISGGTVWTGFVLPDFTDEYSSLQESEGNASAIEQFDQIILDAFGNQPVDIQELTRYRATDSSEQRRKLRENMWRPTKKFLALLHSAGRLADASAPQRVLMRFVCLGPWRGTHSNGALDRTVDSFVGVVDEIFSADDLSPYWRQVDLLRHQMVTHGARALQRDELLWAIRKTFSGHLEPSDLALPSANVTDDGQKIPVRPWGNGFFAMLGGFHGLNHGNHIELRRRGSLTDDSTSYVATLVVVNKPPEQVYSKNSAWLIQLKAAGHLVEMNDRARLIPADQFRDELRKIVGNIIDEAEDRAAAGAVNDASFTRKLDRARQLRSELEDGKVLPARRGRTRIVVSADSLDELETSVADVIRVLHQRGWTVVAPDEAQYLLLEEALPGEAPTVNMGGVSVTGGVGGGGVAYWERLTDTYSQAVGGIASHNQVGDDVEIAHGSLLGWIGPFIGTMQSTDAPVHFDPHVQVARNKGAGVGIFGASGNGKSMLAALLFFNESESGTACVALDLKNDFESFCYYLSFGPQVLAEGFDDDARAGILGTPQSQFQPVDREFWDATRIIDLANSASGLLDPWAISKSFADGDVLARSLLMFLFKDAKERGVVHDAIYDLKSALDIAEQDGRTVPVGLGVVANIVRDKWKKVETSLTENALLGEDASLLRNVHYSLERLRASRFSQLLFGLGAPPGAPAYGYQRIVDQDRRRTIITMHGFTPPPSDNPSEWDEGHRNAAAAVHAAMAATMDVFDEARTPHPLTGVRRVRPRSIYVDEAKMLLQIPAGRALISKGLRQGRSLNLCIIIITQQADDLAQLEKEASQGHTDTNQIGTIFCFANSGYSEALNALNLLRNTKGLNENEITALATRLLEVGPGGGTLGNSVCVMRDVNRRIGAVRINPVFEELRNAGQTNASLEARDKSTPLPADGEDWHLILPTFSTIVEDASGNRFDVAGSLIGWDFDNHHDPADSTTDNETVNVFAGLGSTTGEPALGADPFTDPPPHTDADSATSAATTTRQPAHSGGTGRRTRIG